MRLYVTLAAKYQRIFFGSMNSFCKLFRHYSLIFATDLGGVVKEIMHMNLQSGTLVKVNLFEKLWITSHLWSVEYMHLEKCFLFFCIFCSFCSTPLAFIDKMCFHICVETLVKDIKVRSKTTPVKEVGDLLLKRVNKLAFLSPYLLKHSGRLNIVSLVFKFFYYVINNCNNL